MSDSNNSFRYAEVTGGVFVPAVIALAYGLYLLIGVDSHSTNGWLLTSLGALSLIAALAPEAAGAFVPLLLVGLYTFAVLGCVGLGLAISEASGAWVIVRSAFWILFGWYALNRAARLRRFGRETVDPLYHDAARRGPPPRSGEDL